MAPRKNSRGSKEEVGHKANDLGGNWQRQVAREIEASDALRAPETLARAQAVYQAQLRAYSDSISAAVAESLASTRNPSTTSTTPLTVAEAVSAAETVATVEPVSAVEPAPIEAALTDTEVASEPVFTVDSVTEPVSTSDSTSNTEPSSPNSLIVNAVYEIIYDNPHLVESIFNNKDKMSLTNCRYYEEKYPEIDSFVMVNVKQIAEMGAYVKLLEYDNIDGMILLSELSRRRIRSIQKLIRVGRNEVVVVLRVDKEKGYIDLSKRRVSPEDIVKCEERYNKGKLVHSILRHVAEKTIIPIEELYEKIGWPLNKRYGHAVDAFKISISNPEVWNDIEFPNEASAKELKDYIAKRLTPQPVKVRADVEVTCFGYEGIDAIKTALRTAEAQNIPDCEVKVRLVSPPLYFLTVTCLDKDMGIAKLEQSLKDIDESIRTFEGGNCVVKMKPKAVTQNDDAELAALMEQRARENEEISGDDSESGSDDEAPLDV